MADQAYEFIFNTLKQSSIEFGSVASKLASNLEDPNNLVILEQFKQQLAKVVVPLEILIEGGQIVLPPEIFDMYKYKYATEMVENLQKQIKSKERPKKIQYRSPKKNK